MIPRLRGSMTKLKTHYCHLEGNAVTRDLFSHSVQGDSEIRNLFRCCTVYWKIYLNLASIHPAPKKRVTQPPIHYCHSDREVLFTSTRDLPHSVQSYSRDAESLSFRARRYRDTKSFKWCNFLLKLCIKLLSFLFWIAQKRNKKD